MGYCLPVVVDLPESTWPITTTLMCIFSLLCWRAWSAAVLCTICTVEWGAERRRKQGYLPHDGGIFSYLLWKFGICCEVLEVKELKVKVSPRCT